MQSRCTRNCGFRKALTLIIPILLVGPCLSAQSPAKLQSPADNLPEFEVASVRPTSPNERILNGFFIYPGGMIVATGCTLDYLLQLAFSIKDFQISGAPHWIEEERYDIQAKPPATSASSKSDPSNPKLPPTTEQRQMLQSLLIDRFQLKFHQGTKEGKIYILTADDKNLKLRPPKDTNAYPWAGGIEGGLSGGEGVKGTNISMSQLADRLGQWLQRPVSDKTGLPGSYDFEFRNGEADADSSIDIASSVLTSLKGIGLNLHASKGPVDTLVIDHIERPTGN